MSEPSQPRPATRAIHLGQRYKGETGAVMPPPWLTSTFAHGNPAGFDYTRSGNPSFQNLEEVVASLESASHATAFASGVSAITAIVSTLKSGDLVLAEENIYGCTYRLFAQVFAKFGVQVEYLNFAHEGTWQAISEKNPALVWIETPTNPLLKIIDIAGVASVCHEAGAPLVVDNTFASSLLQRPLELGATLSLLSLTKYTNGHSDALGGAVATHDPEWNEKLLFSQKALGLQPAPFDCWLIQRGARTEALRMKAHSENALSLARYLESDLQAPLVRYPFLESHPQHALAERQMTGGSGIVIADFGLPLEETLERAKALRWFTLAESLGGIESLICHPASMTHASVPKAVREKVGITDSLIRFSVGIEAMEDLLEDVAQAFA
ncbi:MAG: PLP-dependent transferase [Verrucomicrobiota bacterium]